MSNLPRVFRRTPSRVEAARKAGADAMASAIIGSLETLHELLATHGESRKKWESDPVACPKLVIEVFREKYTEKTK